MFLDVLCLLFCFFLWHGYSLLGVEELFSSKINEGNQNQGQSMGHGKERRVLYSVE